MIGSRCTDNLQSFEPSHPVIHMDHQIARAQALGFGEEIVGPFALFRAAHQTITQNILLGDHQEIIGFKAMFQRRDRQICARAAQAFNIADLNQLPMPLILQQARQALSGARRVGGNHHRLGGALVLNMVRDRTKEAQGLVLTLRRKIAAKPRARIQDIQPRRLWQNR